MMDIKHPSPRQQGGVFRFFTRVDETDPDMRKCCADTYLRMVSDGPPGHPKSCLVAGTRCPFELGRPPSPTETTSTPTESQGMPFPLVVIFFIIMICCCLLRIIVGIFGRDRIIVQDGGEGAGAGAGACYAQQ